MKKFMSLLVICAMLATLLVGCKSASQGNQNGSSQLQSDVSKPVTLKVVFWADQTKAAFKKLSDDYHKANPNVTISWEFPANSDYTKILSTRILSGESPDLFGGIDPTFFQYGVSAESQPWAANVITKSGISLNDKLVGLPLDYTPCLVYYNKTVFSQAGITEEPKTWSDFLSLCATLKSKGITPIAFGMKDMYVHNVALTECTQAFGASVTMDFYKQLYLGKDKYASHPLFQSGLEKYLELYQKGYFSNGCISVDANTMYTQLANGSAAMCLQGSWLPGFVWQINSKCDLGAFAFPDSDSGASAIGTAADFNLMVSKSSKNQTECWKFLSFLAQSDNYAYLSEQWQTLPDLKDITCNLKPVMTKSAKLVTQAKVCDLYYCEDADPSYELDNICQQMFLGQKTPAQVVSDYDKLLIQNKDTMKTVFGS